MRYVSGCSTGAVECRVSAEEEAVSLDCEEPVAVDAGVLVEGGVGVDGFEAGGFLLKENFVLEVELARKPSNLRSSSFNSYLCN